MKPSQYLRKAYKAGVVKATGKLHGNVDTGELVGRGYDVSGLGIYDPNDEWKNVPGYCALGIIGRCVGLDPEELSGLSEYALAQWVAEKDPDLSVLLRPTGRVLAKVMRDSFNAGASAFNAKKTLFTTIFTANDRKVFLDDGGWCRGTDLTFQELANLLEAGGY